MRSTLCRTLLFVLVMAGCSPATTSQSEGHLSSMSMGKPSASGQSVSPTATSVAFIPLTPTLTPPPCNQPCWYGLRPGVSTLEDLQKYAEAHLTSQELAQSRGSMYRKADCQSFGWVTEKGQRGRSFNLQGGIITYMRIEADHGIYLREMVSELGFPEYVYSALESPGPGEVWLPRYTLKVYFPSQGVTLQLVTHERGEIGPDLLVAVAEYSRPGSLLETVWAAYLCPRLGTPTTGDAGIAELGRDTVEEEVYYVQPWTGYGKIRVLERQPHALPIQRRTPAATPKVIQP